jgi:hypothetical protein
VAGREELLAARLGCLVSVIHASATTPLDPADRSILRWGSGAIRREHLHTRSRRVSPTALMIASHHRAAWCHRLLDHCPETLELLTDRCSRCGRTQTWLAARGIGFCDERGCGPLEGSGVFLPDDLADGYRTFAAICSPVPDERASAVAGLTSELQDLPPVALTAFALMIGLALEGSGNSMREALCKLSPSERSRAASGGAASLDDWPNRLRHDVRAELKARGVAHGDARRKLRAGLLSATIAQAGGERLRNLMLKALPEINVEVGRSFAGLDEEQILGSVAAKRIGVKHPRLQQLARSGIFEEEGIVEADRRRALYSAGSIAAAADARRNSSPIGYLMRQLGLPRYACEHIVGASDVEAEKHPFAMTMPGQPRVRTASAETYLNGFMTLRGAAFAPADVIRIDLAMKAVGGRLKPWRQVLLAIRRELLRAWLVDSPGPLIARLLIRPSELARFAALDARHGVDPEAFTSTLMSQIDAMTVLNLRQVDGPRLIAANLIHFEKGARALLANMEDVLDVARDYVSTAEAAASLNEGPKSAWHRVTRALGAQSSPAGWPRSRFEERFVARRS